jgi:ADP-ribose pyrophosphatase
LSRPYLDLVDEEVRAPSGVVRRWLTVQRKAAVVIAPLTHSGAFVLVREERIPVRATLWSFPAGQIDQSGEIVETARRELREETGYEVAATGEIKPLGSFFTSPGLTNERVHLCLARPVERHAEVEDEMILEVREFGPADLRQMIIANEIRDSNTLSMCARLAAAGILDLAMSI